MDNRVTRIRIKKTQSANKRGNVGNTLFGFEFNKSKRMTRNSGEGIEQNTTSKPQTPGFGIDVNQFINEKSEMFEYFTRQEFAAEPLYVRSVQDAIKNYEREQRDFQNLKYNAAYMGRDLEYCEECRLKHPPLRKNVVDEE